MLVNDTRPWRRALWAYSRTWLEGYRPDGFTVETSKKLGKPARTLVTHVQRNLHARGLLEEDHIDGTLNQRTQDLLIPPLTHADHAVAYALSQIGVHESPWGTNRGDDVHRYQSSTGAYNEAWCASFFWYCWQQAGYKGAVSAGAWNSTDHHGTHVADLNHAIPGDGVSFDIGEGHIGIFLHKTATEVFTVDGNTNDQVAIRSRPIGEIHSICRPTITE